MYLRNFNNTGAAGSRRLLMPFKGSIVCPSCGKDTHGKAPFCAQCGKALPAATAPSPAPTPNPAPSPAVTAPAPTASTSPADTFKCECGGEVKKGAKFCSDCGKRFITKCPNCGHEVANKKFCPDCGAELSAASVKKAATTTKKRKPQGFIDSLFSTLVGNDE